MPSRPMANPMFHGVCSHNMKLFNSPLLTAVRPTLSIMASQAIHNDDDNMYNNAYGGPNKNDGHTQDLQLPPCGSLGCIYISFKGERAVDYLLRAVAHIMGGNMCSLGSLDVF